MILQALHDYYQRKQRDPDPARRLPAYGFEDKEIPFIIELDADGALLGLKDTRQLEGKKKVAARFLVPQGVKKTSGVAANLLWDTAEYVVGIDTKGKPERVVQQRAAFRERIEALPAQDAPAIRAVLAFLGRHPVAELASQPAWPEVLETNPLMSFRVAPDTDLVCQRPEVLDGIGNDAAPTDANGICLVTGRRGETERLHSAIKGVWGAQTSGANIVSVNNKNENGNNSGQTPAFASFNKQQGFNAPVSRSAAFAYTTALNHLLGRGSRQRIQVGDASTVFWAEKADAVEDIFATILGEGDDPDTSTGEVRALYEAVHSGKFNGARGETRFFVLGLAPNAARISVRFWHVAPLSEIAQRITQWFDDLSIDHAAYEREFPPLKTLLASLCLPTKERPYGDIDHLPETIGGEILRSIFFAGPLPVSLINLAIQRCRADQARKVASSGKPAHHVSYFRAALLKAALNRHFRIHETERKEIDVSLDTENPDQPYLLGRLFAVFERMQEAAAERELNRSIRDSFFGAAMATPLSVFPRLVRLNQHHLRDLKRTRPKTATFYDRTLREINDKLTPPPFPANLLLKDQGVFALGYYHQRQAFFTKSTPAESTEPLEETL